MGNVTKLDTYSFSQLVPYLSHKNIVFDLNGVLLKPNNRFFIAQIGLLRIACYSIWHRTSPFNILKKLINFMNIIEPPSTIQNKAKYFDGDFLPGLICDWQLDTKSNEEIITIIDKQIKQLVQQKFFASKLEETVISKAAHALFTPSILADQGIDLITEGIEILNACATKKTITNQPKHNLYLLTNFNTQVLSLLQQRFQDVFNCFSGIVTSAQAQSMKPEQQIFTYLIKKYNIKPEQTLYLDDQEENVFTALDLGFNAIHLVEEA